MMITLKVLALIVVAELVLFGIVGGVTGFYECHGAGLC